METLKLDPKTTALVLIDLQNGMMARDTKPYTAKEVAGRARTLAAAFRAKGAPVVYVHVDLANFLRLPADQQTTNPNDPPPPASASEISPEAGMQPGDLLVTKRHWGAFAGTDLEAKLRERGVQTVVIGGIATNLGVESTVRQGTGLGFAFVIAEDACATFTPEMQRFAMETIFPRLARVRSTADILQGLQ